MNIDAALIDIEKLRAMARLSPVYVRAIVMAVPVIIISLVSLGSVSPYLAMGFAVSLITSSFIYFIIGGKNDITGTFITVGASLSAVAAIYSAVTGSTSSVIFMLTMTAGIIAAKALCNTYTDLCNQVEDFNDEHLRNQD